MRRSIVTEGVELDSRVFVFDMDDTLYLERDFARSGFAAVGELFAHRFDQAAFAQVCFDLLDRGERGNIFDLALREIGVEPEDRLIGDLVAAYRRHTPTIRMCDDAQRFLDQLGEAPTGLISDGPSRTQAAKVVALGLEGHIDHIILTGAWPEGYGKPHPRAFERIQQLTGFAANEIAYIADNAAKDFVAPNKLGWQTVQIMREDRIHTGSPPSPDYAAMHVVASFDEISISADLRLT